MHNLIKGYAITSLLAIVICIGCSQATIQTVLQDGAEAGTVLAMTTVQIALPLEAAAITAGMKIVSTSALSILNDKTTTATLQQVIDLAFSNDPNLAKYQSIVTFVLPVLMDIPGVQGSLNIVVTKLPANVRADAIAFFTGIQIGLGDNPTPATLELLKAKPGVAGALKKLGPGKFDVNGLITNLQKLGAKK